MREDNEKCDFHHKFGYAPIMMKLPPILSVVLGHIKTQIGIIRLRSVVN